jgi:hypothetical protein
VEAELARARAEVAAHGRPDWDEHPEVSDTLLPDPEPLLEERARLFEQAYRLELQLPDVRPYEDQQATLSRRIAQLDAAARAGFQQKSLKEAEMVLLDRVAQARRVGGDAEPIPLLVNDALAAFDPEERQDLLHLLARLAETIQIVYLTEDPVTLEWAAAQAQAGEALVIGPAPPSPIASVA